MTIMTGVHHEYGAYKPLTPLAEALMKHEELARIIKMSQFSGGDEWIEFLGKEQSDILIKNLDDWVNIFYLAPKDLDLKKAMETIEVARKNLLDFINNYNSPQEIQAFMEARKIADQKTMEAVKQVVSYNSDTNEFEEVKAL